MHDDIADTPPAVGHVEMATQENADTWSRDAFEFIRAHTEDKLAPFQHLYNHFDTLEKVRESALWRFDDRARLIGIIRSIKHDVVGIVGVVIHDESGLVEPALYITESERGKGYASKVAYPWIEGLMRVLPSTYRLVVSSTTPDAMMLLEAIGYKAGAPNADGYRPLTAHHA